MDTLAPPVVAVVVAHDPGPWFEETLASLASQDYAELSVLVLDVGTDEDLPARVAAVLPTAYVRHFEKNRGFGATANEVRTMVDGAAYFLLCHDDIALFPDTVHLMVEEAFRSNAGIVSPKVVSWEDPERLVHVGMTVDKVGSVVNRVQPHEIDHGQHDAVRDVFVAPGGVTLVRADLFEELGGFDPSIVAMGEDLDLCWRAQVVGARIIVAPDARIRHREVLAGGARPLDPGLFGQEEESESATKGQPSRPPSLQELERRHELLAVFKCYGLFSLIRVVPQVIVLTLAEIIVAELAGNRTRARAVARAWRWNLGRLRTIRRERKSLKGHRRLGDKEIRLLQIGGSARLSAYTRRVFQHGFHGAHADELAAATDAEEYDAAEHGVGQLSAVRPGRPTEPARGRLSGRVRVTAWVVAFVVVLIGSRGVISGRLPVVGQFAPFPGWSLTWAQFGAGWHPSGVGTTAPATPALALVGLVATVLLGAMGLTLKVLIFACVPIGVWGVVRLLRPFGSQRASLVAGLAYLAVALPYNGLALGRWGAMVLYAGVPWVLARLFRATGTLPFAAPAPGSEVRWSAHAGSSFDGSGRLYNLVRRLVAWTARHSEFRQMVTLGLLEAVLVSFAPAAAVVILLCALALVASSIIFGDWASTLRSLRLAVGSTVVTALICLPWVIGVLSAGSGAISVFGVPVPASESANWGSLLRFAVGPIGDSPLAWGFALAAVVPLVLARGTRFRWAGRFWSIALVFWLVAWVMGRGWTGSFVIDPLVLLAPAATAMAAAIGLGVAAFEEDLRAADFGWRQLAGVIATGAVILGAVPTVISAAPGRWDLPTNDFRQSVAWMHAKASSGSFRVLWLGDTRALNQGSWASGDGLSYATSEDGAPDARWLWNAAGVGPAASLSTAVNLARSGRTDQLGRLLAPAGVRYVVVLTSLAPEISGEQSPEIYPVPGDLVPSLGRQLDLNPVLSGTGITVYVNADWIPSRAEVAATAAGAAPPPTSSMLTRPPGSSLVAGAVPVLPGPIASRSFKGPVRAGMVFASVAPAGRWSLSGSTGRTATRSPSFGWAARFRVDAATVATFTFSGGWITPVSFLVSILTWLVAVVFLVSTRVGTRRGRNRRRLIRRGAPGRDIGAAEGVPAPSTDPAVEVQ
jgi:GT2 family glycosyltransferase